MRGGLFIPYEKQRQAQIRTGCGQRYVRHYGLPVYRLPWRRDKLYRVLIAKRNLFDAELSLHGKPMSALGLWCSTVNKKR